VAVTGLPALAQSCAIAWYTADLSESLQEDEEMQELAEETLLLSHQDFCELAPPQLLAQLLAQLGQPLNWAIAAEANRVAAATVVN